MIQQIKYLFAFLLLALLPMSCVQSNDLAEDISLEVEESSIVVPRAGEERLISIETNAKDWSYLSAEEGKWLTLSKENNNLRVVVDENTIATRRVGHIVIASGNVQKEITIEQIPADIQLELIGGKDGVVTLSNLPAAGGTRRVDFFSNNEAIEVEVAEGADWLLVKDKDEHGLLIEAKENTERLSRTGVVYIKSLTAKQTLRVSQVGKLYYVLPMIGKTVTLNQALTYEYQRNSRVGRLGQLPTDRTDQGIYRLELASPIAALVSYEYVTPNQDLYNEAWVLYRDRKNLIDNPEFDAFMKEMGFPKKGKDLTQRITQYSQDTETGEGFVAQIFDFGENGAGIFVSQGIEQRGSYPTFDVFPLKEEMNFLGGEPLFSESGEIVREPFAGKIKMKYIIDEYDSNTKQGKGHYLPGGLFEREIKRGSTFHEKQFWFDPDLYWFYFFRNNDPYISSIKYHVVTEWDYGFLFDDEKNPDGTYKRKGANPEKYKYLLDDIYRAEGYTTEGNFNRIFFVSPTGQRGITKEFVELMKKEGFDFIGTEENYFYFFNEKETLSVTIYEWDNQQIMIRATRNRDANRLRDTAALARRDFARYDKQRAQLRKDRIASSPIFSRKR
ncbi:MAG: BACON domain-containing protein [Bacteroidales bacterium]|nr:BACON domain-containing protein [Bacteroidales bacterium]